MKCTCANGEWLALCLEKIDAVLQEWESEVVSHTVAEEQFSNENKHVAAAYALGSRGTCLMHIQRLRALRQSFTGVGQ